MNVYSSKTIANEFINMARNEGRSLNSIELNCLVYFASVDAMTSSRGQNMLITDAFEARDCGPVCRSLANEFGLSVAPIENFASEGHMYNERKNDFARTSGFIPVSDAQAYSIVSHTWNDYKGLSCEELQKEAKEGDSPWFRAHSFGEGSYINNSDIMDCYFLRDEKPKSAKRVEPIAPNVSEKTRGFFNGASFA